MLLYSISQLRTNHGKIKFFVLSVFLFVGITLNMANSMDKHTQPFTMDAVEKMDGDKVEAADKKKSGGRESTDGIMNIISDYLCMDPLKFQKKYTMDELYEKGILYCNKNARKYDGSQLDAFQDDHYVVEDITVIRIYKNSQFQFIIT